MTVANKDDKLVSLRANFGMWGVGVYWTLVELVAEQVTEKSEKANANLIISELLGLFGCKRNKLDSFLEHSQNISLMKTGVDGNILTIDIPKILDFADNYIKYNGKSLKSLQRHSSVSSKQEEEVEEDIDKKKIKTFIPPTAEEVQSYAHSIEFQIDGESFIDFYTSKGWMIGKNKMKDWKAAVRTWKRTSRERKNGSASNNNRQTPAQQRATFRHTEEDKPRFNDLKSKLEQLDRDRGKSS